MFYEEKILVGFTPVWMKLKEIGILIQKKLLRLDLLYFSLDCSTLKLKKIFSLSVHINPQNLTKVATKHERVKTLENILIDLESILPNFDFFVFQIFIV